MENMYGYFVCSFRRAGFMPKISGRIADVLILGEMVIMAIVLVLYAFEFRKMAK